MSAAGGLKENAVVSSRVKDQSLLARDFRRGQLPKGARGIQGAAGPQGPQGAQGLQGPKGDTGTPDTSNFYDKAASDSRFLGLNATAHDSARLGNLLASSYVKGVQGGLLFQDVRTVPVNAFPQFFPFPGLHTRFGLHFVCVMMGTQTSPTPVSGFRNDSAETFDLFQAANGSVSIHGIVPPGPGVLQFNNGPPSNGSLITVHGAFANNDTLTLTIGSYATATDCHFITQGMIATSP